MTTGDDDNDEAGQANDLGAQVGVAADAIRAAVLMLLHEGRVHPHLMLRAEGLPVAGSA